MTENSADYEFSLTNQFFTDIDAPEIQKGKLQVQLNVKKTMGVYVLTFHIEGSVIVPCDRCLDDMELPVVTDDTLKVKLGATFSDEDDMVIVPEEDGYINVAWFMYEFIALSLPMKHVHAPGQCNKSMMGALNKHLRTSVEEEGEMTRMVLIKGDEGGLAWRHNRWRRLQNYLTFLITAPVFRVKLVWSIYDVSLIIAFLFS